MKRLSLLVLCLLPIAAVAGGWSGLPATVAGATTTNANSALPLQQGAGLAVQGTYLFGGDTTSNVVFTFYLTADGTNFVTAPWATVTVAGNGTNTVTWGTNWPAATLAGWQQLRLGSIQNTHATIVLTNRAVWFNFGPY